jgi:streptomycin 3"-adenylyltransferase
MPYDQWPDCPADVGDEVNQLVAALQEALGRSLIGVYLHGSLAMGCFNPNRSDIDVLVVTRNHTQPNARRKVAEALLRLSNHPYPIEISLLTKSDLHPWWHPTPFDLHFSEEWREKFIEALTQDAFQPEAPLVDGDLAGHVTVVRQRGVALFGPPAADVFPVVPREDYLDSVQADVLESLSTIHDNHVYAVLNACRTLAYLADGAIRSKDEGGMWALAHLPEDQRFVVAHALQIYRGEARPAFDPSALERFARFASNQIATLTHGVRCAGRG